HETSQGLDKPDSSRNSPYNRNGYLDRLNDFFNQIEFFVRPNLLNLLDQVVENSYRWQQLHFFNHLGVEIKDFIEPPVFNVIEQTDDFSKADLNRCDGFLCER